MKEMKRYYLNDKDTEVIKVAICNRLDYLLGEYREENPSLAGLWQDIYKSISLLAYLGYEDDANYYQNMVDVIKGE